MKPRNLEDFAGPFKMSGDQRIYERCPMGSHGPFKLYVEPVGGKWICFVCNKGGKVRTISTPGSLRKRLFMRDRGVPEFLPVDLPVNYPLLSGPRKIIEEKYQLSPESLDKYLLVASIGSLGVYIPYPNASGDIVYYAERIFNPWDGAPKYVGMGGPKPLYVPEYLRSLQVSRDVVLVEGPFDAMSLHDRLEICAIAVGGKSLAEHQLEQLKRLEPNSIQIMLDREPQALGAAMKLKRMLAGKMPRVPVKIVLCPGGDPAKAETEALKEALK